MVAFSSMAKLIYEEQVLQAFALCLSFGCLGCLGAALSCSLHRTTFMAPNARNLEMEFRIFSVSVAEFPPREELRPILVIHNQL